MSRHTITNYLDLDEIIGDNFTNTERAVHRQLIVVESAPQGWLISYALNRKIPCIPADTCTDQSDQVTAMLGAEHPILAHEIADPMNAGLLAALAGTITYAGLLILAIPFAVRNEISVPLRETKAAGLPLKNTQRAPSSRFCQRFARLLNATEKAVPDNIFIATYQADDTLCKDMQPSIHGSNITFKARNPGTRFKTCKDEQDSLLRKACTRLDEEESLCILIIGKRGRGKSALTARIANYLHSQHISYAITAVHSTALSTFHSITDHSNDRHCISVQQLNKCNTDTLIVDEASNMPLALLQTLMTRHNRLILCTTVEGYESSGRAFELRLQAPIKSNFTSQLLLTPEKPWRWLQNDPIELLIDSLVLNTEKNTPDESNCLNYKAAELINVNNVSLRKVTQQHLLENEHELGSIFELLRNTHYQTTVKDLQHLLDGKDVSLWVLEENTSHRLIGVLLLVVEPGINHSLHEAILHKKRRLPHHLLSQLLAQTAHSTDHLTLCFARVVRISLVRSLRRKGLGSKLLNHVEQELLSETSGLNGVKAIGASFANDSKSVKFWQSNGYTPFHQGYRKNPRTGKNAIAVLKSSNATINKTLNIAADILADNQTWRSANTSYSEFSPTHRVTQVQVSDLQLLEQFANGYRSVHDTYAALSRLSIKHHLALDVRDGISRKRFEKSLREQVASILGL